MIVDELTGWRRLACAVLVRAWRDAHSTNGDKAAKEAGISAGVGLAGDARAFLESDGAAWLALMLEFDPAGVDHLRHQLPPVEWGQLSLMLEM